MGWGWKNSEAFNKKSLDCLEEIIDRNMDVKGAFGEDLEMRNILLESGGKAVLVI